jgi:hypothetical protein
VHDKLLCLSRKRQPVDSQDQLGLAGSLEGDIMGLLLSVLVIMVWQADILTANLELAQGTPDPGQVVKTAVLHPPEQT